MTVGNVLCYSAAAVIGMVLLCLGVMYLEKKVPGKDYDERQKLVRGNAYRLSFAVGIGYQMILFVLVDLEKELPLESSTMIFIGLLVQVLVSHIYCLLNHAALPLSQKARLSIGAYLLAGFVHLANFRNRMELYQKIGSQLGYAYAEPWEDIWLTLILAVSFFVMAAMHLIALAWEKKE